jgi:hypothetical protein
MMILDDGARDRSRASEHAIVLQRKLHVPARKAARLLPLLQKRLAGKVSLMVSGSAEEETSLPVEVVLRPSADSSDWRIELRCSSPLDVWDFFEGDVRLDDEPPHASRALLIGRFAFLRGRADNREAGALRDIAERNVTRIFERILQEVESANVVKAG